MKEQNIMSEFFQTVFFGWLVGAIIGAFVGGVIGAIFATTSWLWVLCGAGIGLFNIGGNAWYQALHDESMRQKFRD